MDTISTKSMLKDLKNFVSSFYHKCLSSITDLFHFSCLFMIESTISKMKSEKILENLTDQRVAEFTSKLQVGREFILYDFSKTHLKKSDLLKFQEKLTKLKLSSKIDQMWEGKNINYTEERPVLHYLLRSKEILASVEKTIKEKESEKKEVREFVYKTLAADLSKMKINKNIIKEGLETDGKTEKSKARTKSQVRVIINKPDKFNSKNDGITKAKEEITTELLKIYDFCNIFEYMKGVTGKELDTIVNIGIGGSDLGPKMVTDSLQYYSSGKKVYFISNVDASNAIEVFNKIDVEKTLFIVVSKTFTTVETIENFKLCLKLFKKYLLKIKILKNDDKEICNKHFIAVSANVPEAKKYGIATVFKMWDFVGGRYSLWSSVGLSIALYIGFNNYFQLLKGASIADHDFNINRLESISVKMAINELFYIEQGYNNKCLVAYDNYLGLLYKYLQQAEMESNGKHGSKQMIIWGGVGTDVQHSFFQLLHQGEQHILTEFLIGIKGVHQKSRNQVIFKHHQLLLANCLAQSRSLMIGRKSEDKNKHFDGDKPSVTILYSRLTPATLGALLAIYEHKIFVTGIYYKINSFDQFGVQLGKDIANEIKVLLEGKEGKTDPSTKFLIDQINKK